MKFNWVTINVSDMEKSLAFYKDAMGIPVANEIHTPDMDIMFLGEGDMTQVELIRSATAPAPSATTSIGFTMEQEKIDKIVAAYNEGSTTNGRFWFVKDPDGYKVQLIPEKK